MGQTLTHGIYLPDEGERNCYAGLAANWSILDGAVGTVAEHTSALSGKAPLVHTHTKSDVTDLLNSNFIPSANNSYNLGSSSYQWNNAYIKSLTINGVACGDILTHNASEFVDVNSNQTIDGNKEFTSNISVKYYLKATKYINFNDNSSIYISGGSGWNLGGQIFINGKNNTTIDNEGNITADGGGMEFKCVTNLNGVFSIYFNNNNSIKEPQFSPTHTTINLGTSTNKWKSFNGINPGALSLPDYDRFEPIDFSQWNVNLGWGNTYTPSEDGWLYAEINDTATNSIYIYSAGLQPVQSVNRRYGISAQGNGSQNSSVGRLAVMIPVRKDIQYRFMIKASSVNEISAIIFYPCVGNV